MPKMYKASTLPSIEEIEVDRFTDKSVWIKGKRAARGGDYFDYFETPEEALEYINKSLSFTKASAEKRLAWAEKKLREFEAMKAEWENL